MELPKPEQDLEPDNENEAFVPDDEIEDDAPPVAANSAPNDDESDDDQEFDEDEVQPNGAASEELTELVQYIASKLVHNPEEVVVESEFRGGTVYVSLRVPEEEMGRVIGREGRTAKAIRTLVSIAGSRHNVHARLDIDG